MKEVSLGISSATQSQRSIVNFDRTKMVNNDQISAAINEAPVSPNKTSCSSDEENTIMRVKKRVHRFYDSDSNTDTENDNQKKSDYNTAILSDSNSEKAIIIALNSIDSHTDNPTTQKVINKSQQSRIESKRNKLREKFRHFKSRPKQDNDTDSLDESNINSEGIDQKTIVDNNKQEVRDNPLFKSSICDPDTSDEEDEKEANQKEKQPKHKKQTKTILTSPKPMRISAKQAMENKHKIKSESNRLLREKEVSLPYHRPKALSLKDILNRRKPAFTIDGKVLPIKMNEHQLKEYVLLLEQRQKEIMELCKSDTDEENDKIQEDNGNTVKEPIVTDHDNNLFSHDNQLLENSISNIMLIEKPAATCDANKEQSTDQNLTYEESKVIDEVANENISNIALEKDSDIEICITHTVPILINDNIQVIATDIKNDMVVTEDNKKKTLSNLKTITNSQTLSLYYDSEKSIVTEMDEINSERINVIENEIIEEFDNNEISDSEFDLVDIDKIIENAEIFTKSNNTNSSTLVKKSLNVIVKPKLTGVAGMVIDLDDNETPRKRTGIELLKERFTYFAKLKTPEELEREREKSLKPGTQHQKLKLELQEKIAERRSIEWAKRYEEDKQQQNELKENNSDVEDDIEKMESKLEENPSETEESSEEEEEDIYDTKETTRKKNPMIDDEAEVSDCDDEETAMHEDVNNRDTDYCEENENAYKQSDENISSDDTSDDESSESENEHPTNKKGRILKAFEEDSDEESIIAINEDIHGSISKSNVDEKQPNIVNEQCETDGNIDVSLKESEIIKDSQDDPIQLAQRVNSVSEELFPSQESGVLSNNGDHVYSGTQTFSILDSKLNKESTEVSYDDDEDKRRITNNTFELNSNTAAFETETYRDSFVPTQITKNNNSSESEAPIGEDILALCTGKFYDNEFITHSNENLINDNKTSQPLRNDRVDQIDLPNATTLTNSNRNEKDDRNVLQSILEELNDSEFDSQRPHKDSVSKQNDNTLMKKKFVIDSDEEDNETIPTGKRKKKYVKKRKPENRALQISDDEETEYYNDDEISEDDIEDGSGERVVDYDSEENEIEMKPEIKSKKKRKGNDFFEEEAELTSEDEWVGSGDEDEADLDRMEREEGDNDIFHQGKLQKELGQIHMRDVLDQDKREVRLIQELLFEDGDLGDGHRQRKFRWKNADGDEDTGMAVEGVTDTQEEEFESEELWRKQRHEREVFLKQLAKDHDDSADNTNIGLNRTTIIKANLCSKTMSSLLLEVNSSSTEKTETTDTTVVKEKKSVTDVPSAKNAFSIFQQSYHGSLLTRGKGALARLAALATPLALDENAPNIGSLGPSSRRNFVFASLTPEDKEKCTKVTKRKANDRQDTPRLVKKLKSDEEKLYNKKSLLSKLQV